MERKYKIITFILSGVLVLFIAISSIIFIHEKNNDKNTIKVLTEDEMEDLYNQIVVELDFDELISENDELKSENSALTGTCNSLREYNCELLDKLELYEELQLQPPHESYRECLDELDEHKYCCFTGPVDYVVNQVETRNQDTKTIYHFIIVVYNPDFSVMDLWDCYTIYEDNYFIDVKCNLIETKGE